MTKCLPSLAISITILFFASPGLLLARDYAIEVILFANKSGLYQTAEQFPLNQVLQAPGDGLSLENVDDTSLWKPLNKEGYILNNVATRLKQSGQYRILKHIAWRQPVVDKVNSIPIAIHAGRDFTELFPERAYRQLEFNQTNGNTGETSNSVSELDGTITVVIERYIHFYTDLVYRLPRSNPTQLKDALNRQQVLVDYAIKSHRRMRSKELHYIDHPLVGILIEATPLPEEDPSN